MLNVAGGTELIGGRRISVPMEKRGAVIDAASIVAAVVCATQKQQKVLYCPHGMHAQLF